MFIGKQATESFRMVPDRLWSDGRLEHIDVRLWCVLAFISRGRDIVDATDATLAEKLGVSARTIRYSLARLERCEFITRKRVGEVREMTLRPEGDGEKTGEFILRVIGA